MENTDGPLEDDKYLEPQKFDIEGLGGQSEKITVNLPLMTLAQIEALVDKGHYQNRAEFLRFAALRELEQYESFERSPWNEERERNNMFVVGVLHIYNKTLQKAVEENKLIRIRVVGILTLDDDIDPDLFSQVVEMVKVWGIIKGNAKVKKLAEDKSKHKLMSS